MDISSCGIAGFAFDENVVHVQVGVDKKKYKVSRAAENEFKEYCKALDRFLSERKCKSIKVFVTSDMDVLFEIVCDEFDVCDEVNNFRDVAKGAKWLEFSYGGIDILKMKVLCDGIWKKAGDD